MDTSCYPGPSSELIDGFHLYPVEGEWVIADGGGWLPGAWLTREEAIAGGHAYSRMHGYAPIEDGAGDR